MTTVARLCLSLLTCCLLANIKLFAAEADQPPQFDAAQKTFFQEKVRPLLEARCFQCHAKTAKRLEGSLRLDARSLVLKGGDSGAAAVPGKVAESLLVKAINYDTFEMPPKGKLPQGEIDILTKWVELGLPWSDDGLTVEAPEKTLAIDALKQAHWSWQPIKAQPTPTVKQADWPVSDVDRFVLSKLEQQQLKPSPAADRRTLIRRAYFDVIGLPPTPAEVAAFVNDPAATDIAYEKIVDRLLQSPHFGERWGRHWLDLVRYGETLGHEFDYPLHHAYRYRDYVIRALNADVPYDQFVTEHLAGDLLAQPRLNPVDGSNESVLGTGFWFLGELKHAPVDVKGEEASIIDNQIDVFSKTFLALTVACARCHDHKFDPIPTKDYYALSGFLQSSRRQNAYLDPHGKVQQAVESLKSVYSEMTGKIRASAQQLKAAEISQFLAATREVLYGPAQAIDKLDDAPKDAKKDDKWVRPVSIVATERKLDAAVLQRWVTALSQSDADAPSHPFFAWRQFAKADEKSFAGIKQKLQGRLDGLAQQRAQLDKKSELIADFEGGKLAGWYATGWAFGDAPLQRLEWTRGDETRIPGVVHSGRVGNGLRGVLRSSTFTLSKPTLLYRLAGKGASVRLIIDGYRMDEFSGLLFGGCKLDINNEKWHWQRQGGDVSRYQRHRCHIEIIDEGGGWIAIDEIRLADGDAPTPEVVEATNSAIASDAAVTSLESLDQSLAALIVASGRDEKPVGDAAGWLVNHGLTSNAALIEELAAAKLKAEQLNQAVPEPQYAIAITDGSSEDEQLFIRGSHKNLGPVVPRRMMVAISGIEQPTIKDGSGRMQLVQRVLDPKNPFPARVMANRIWQHLFGRGIVDSVDNFGVLGKAPTHPELLDVLATKFVADGWSTKKLIRTLLLTKTYQMESQPIAEYAERDPQNLWWHRMPVRRLEGEAIRDAMLVISGRFNPAALGPAVPVHLTPFMQGRGRPGGGPLDGDGRRSVYISINRNFLSPMMQAFDTPGPVSTVGRRNVSNVPAQALILMNDDFVISQARLWAKRAIAETPDDPELRVRRLYESAFSRPATDAEVAEAIAFAHSQSETLGSKDQWQKHEQTWADFCHVLFNVKEFVFVK